MQIFRHKTYHAILQEWIAHEKSKGPRLQLARAAGCNPSWLTRVLADEVQLTPDQAAGIADYLHLTDDETDYFLLLVDLERAATPLLKRWIQRKLTELSRESRKLRSALKGESAVSQENAIKYYSSWIYAGVHVACMIKVQSPSEVAKLLNLSESRVGRVIKELRDMGLVTSESEGFIAVSKGVHLPAGSDHGNSGHAIWRQKVIQYFQEGGGEGLHYSGVHCLSRADIDRIQELLKSAVLNCREVITDSPSETLAVMCVDWFEL
jgi:uncharacterized protein (TIGR02147 family)